MTLKNLMAGALVMLVAAGFTVVAHDAENQAARRSSLRTVTGTVVAVSSLPAEGDLQVVAVKVETAGADAEQFEVLLAPRVVLDEIAFGVEKGDSLRVRIFVVDQGPTKAHKAMNLTNGTMVRLRTLREIPLWDTSGKWEGGPCRQEPAGSGGRHRHGQGRGH